MSDPFPLTSDQVEDYAQDDYTTPASMGGQQNQQFVQNEQLTMNEPFMKDEQYVQHERAVQDDSFVEIDIPRESNADMHQVEVNDLLWPVLPGESGEGLPYAPIDWPYAGDIWTWRVGRRFNNVGYFQDRFLYVPKRLGKQCFASKNAVAKYIQSNFPDADIDAFLTSFTWKIPVKFESPTKVEPASLPAENPPQDEKVAGQEEKEEESLNYGGRKRRSAAASTSTPKKPKQNGITPSSTPKRKLSGAKVSSTPKRKKDSRGKSLSTPKQTKQNGIASSSTPKRKTRHSLKRSAPTGEGGAFRPQEAMIAPIPEDFDNYLNSLEDILTQPISETQAPSSATIDSSSAQNELAEARRKLSSLLVNDFPSLILSKNIFELTTLASKLRKDPSLNAEQLVKLKLIEEIPSFSEVFLESRELIAQVDEFSATLEAKKTKVAQLKSEYNELKEKADHLQEHVDSGLLTVQEIDNQIALLQSRRTELTNAIETNKAAKAEVTSAQKVVANAIPRVVHEIQLANSKMPDLELRKSNAVKREAEILAKFAPLEGFSL